VACDGFGARGSSPRIRLQIGEIAAGTMKALPLLIDAFLISVVTDAVFLIKEAVPKPDRPRSAFWNKYA
jgi:hypothetical protein